MPSITSPEDYEFCLVAILRAAGGRATWGHVRREFERKYGSSIPGDAQRGLGGGLRWQRGLEAAADRMAERRALVKLKDETIELT